ncbi:MAG: hypothetical protein ND866_25405 [Pyrinomonadaceae bacterium]|nr:hypothetical protein [Pyrinomonadaceae bacterium]
MSWPRVMARRPDGMTARHHVILAGITFDDLFLKPGEPERGHYHSVIATLPTAEIESKPEVKVF